MLIVCLFPSFRSCLGFRYVQVVNCVNRFSSVVHFPWVCRHESFSCCGYVKDYR